MVLSLGASLLVALTVTLAMCSLLLPGSRAVRSARTPLVVRLVERAYGPTLGLVVRRWKTVTLLSLVALGAALWWLDRAGQSFLREFTVGTLTLSVVTLPTTSMEESNRIGVLEPYTGPAILLPEATGVFFHEAVGHRLEGERQDNDEEGHTFKGQVGRVGGCAGSGAPRCRGWWPRGRPSRARRR